VRQLLVFARAPRPGAVKTRLAPAVGADGACRLYEAFLADLARELRGLERAAVEWLVDGEASGVAAVIGDGWAFSAQAEGDLGERLSSAFRGAFDRGQGPVAALGTDCPLLSAADLEALFGALETPCDAALIPAQDGGYVALALGGRCDEAFEGIPWSTSGVLAATRQALETAGRRVRLLPPRCDVDVAEDLSRLAEGLAAAPGRAPATRAALAAFGRTGPPLRDALGRALSLAPAPLAPDP
jgi:rSAM/selenodomain-associated transferase 1